MAITDAPESTRRAYEKLTNNIDMSRSRIIGSIDMVKVFLCELHNGERGMIWEFKVTRGQVRPRYALDAAIKKPMKTYVASLGILSKWDFPPFGDVMLKRIIAGLPRFAVGGETQLTFIFDVLDEVAVLEHFSWSDGRPLFSTDAKQLRLI